MTKLPTDLDRRISEEYLQQQSTEEGFLASLEDQSSAVRQTLSNLGYDVVEVTISDFDNDGIVDSTSYHIFNGEDQSLNDLSVIHTNPKELMDSLSQNSEQMQEFRYYEVLSGEYLNAFNKIEDTKLNIKSLEADYKKLVLSDYYTDGEAEEIQSRIDALQNENIKTEHTELMEYAWRVAEIRSKFDEGTIFDHTIDILSASEEINAGSDIFEQETFLFVSQHPLTKVVDD